MLAIFGLHISFAEGRSGWVFLLALAAGVALVVYSYRTHIASSGEPARPGARPGQEAGRRTVIGLVVLRSLIVLVLVLYLFRPEVSYERRTAPRAALAVVVDRSRSMAAHDYEGLPDRMRRAVEALAGSGGAIPRLAEDFRVRLFVFDRSARAVEDGDELMDERPEGDVTDLAAGVRGAVERCRSERADVAGVVLFSDGIHTGEPGGEKAGAAGVPVHTIGVGSSRLAEGAFRDVRVSSVRSPSAAPVRSSAKIRVLVEAQGYAGKTITVRIVEGDKELAREEVTLDDLAGDQEVVLRVRPEETGQHECRAVVPVDPAENVLVNNERPFFLNVTDPRIRVLYLEGAVRAEFRFLRRLLERDPQIEPVCIIKVRSAADEAVFRRLGEIDEIKLTDLPRSREDLEPFDVFVIGDLDSTYLAGGRAADIAREVKDGGKGLLLMQGAAAFGAGGYAGTELAGLLPVKLAGRDEAVRTAEFRMTLTPGGGAHPVFEGCARAFAAGSGELPMLEVMNVVARSKAADAVVLAERADLQVEGAKAPVVAAGRAGSGRVLVMTAGPTWRWAFAYRGRQESSPHTRFWGQAVRWLAGEEEEKGAAGVSVRLDRGEALYKPGDAVTVYARLRGADGELVPGAQVDATVTAQAEGTGAAAPSPDDAKEGAKDAARAQTLRLSPSPGRGGEYEAIFTPVGTGRHVLTVRASSAGAELGAATVKLDVEPPGLENERYDLDEKTLAAIAAATGGEYRRLSALDELVGSLRSRQSEKREPVVIRLWHPPMLFILLVALAGSEWYIRRRMQMA